MKHFFLVLLYFAYWGATKAQGSLPDSFFNGKSVVLVSVDPSARPVLSWQQFADSLHNSLLEAGADPVAYYELEQIALSEERQAMYATAFDQRLVKNIILLTRKKENMSMNVGAFSGDGKIILSTSLYGVQGNSLEELKSSIASIGDVRPSMNLLVIDVPEFGKVQGDEESASLKFIPEYPLNLEVFKMGIPIEGSSASKGLLSYFRYDLYGKSEASILAEQTNQKTELEEILERTYPHEYVWLAEAKAPEELIQERIQFLLMKVEGREADMMKSMGLDPKPEAQDRIVVKYYIKLLVRDELYIGTEWDADPNWRTALDNFLNNLKK